MDEIIFITTPLYYVNARPHIGHGYTQVAADTLARYYRQKGKKVYFLTGTDEHGEKIFRAAREKKLAPEEFVEAGVKEFKDLWEKLNISYDRFIRTTEKAHIETVEKVLSRLYEKGLIYKGSYSGLYCVPCESFHAQSQTEGENCPDCGRKVRELSQESYFFKLSAFKDRLLEHIDKNPRFIMPESRKNEIKGFLSNPLKDLSISRIDVEWGIQLPFNRKHTVYVWVDALLNYISAPGYISDLNTFKKLWPADMQLIGKDILKFHAVIWPAMLMALELPLPRTVFAHGWWTVEGNKMSKSLGNVVDPNEVVDKWGVDAFRFFLLRQVAFGQDGNFSKELFKERYNSELANELGNLLSRVLGMIEKYAPEASPPETGEFKNEVEDTLDVIEELYARAAFNEVLDKIWEIVRKANSYVEEKKPWVLAKNNSRELCAVLGDLFRMLRLIAGLIYPFMPAAAKNMLAQMGVDEEALNTVEWKKEINLENIKKGEPLFLKK